MTCQVLTKISIKNIIMLLSLNIFTEVVSLQHHQHYVKAHAHGATMAAATVTLTIGFHCN